MIVLVPLFGARSTLLVMIALAAAIAGSAAYAFAAHALLLDATVPLITAALLYTVLVYASYSREESQRRQIRSAFGQYLSPARVEQLVNDPSQMNLGGEHRNMTFLFSDIRGFTAISERYRDDPADLTELINRYMTPMTDTILANQGTIDKYIGDAIMAIWNAPADDPDHAANACAAALAFQRANVRLNAEFEREGWPLYRTRIGLHTGEAVVGNIGSADRMNYTALGATVNLAARLEGLNKNYGTTILVSSALQQRGGSRFLFRSVDRISPKGFVEAFEIYELRSERADGDAQDCEFCREWESVYAALRNGPLAVADQELAAFLAKYPRDGLAQYHRIAHARTNGTSTP
jgi:adenylate cyclase